MSNYVNHNDIEKNKNKYFTKSKFSKKQLNEPELKSDDN